MKIVFLYPHYVEKIGRKDRVEMPPLGMLSVCAALRSDKHEVQVFPLNDGLDIGMLPSADIYAYAITATVTYPIFKRVVPQIRSKAKLHIAGNAHASAFPNRTLSDLDLDAVFIGEAEESLKKWIDNGCQQRRIIVGDRVNINYLSAPARGLLPDKLIYLNHRVGGKLDNVISVTSSRGCPFKCAFCAVGNRGKVFFLNQETFQCQVARILEEYPACQGLVLMDETFTLNRDHALGICKVLGKTDLPWECNSRADTLSEDIMGALVDNNCQEVKVGMETGSQKMLDLMKKQINLTDAEATIKKAYGHGLRIKFYIMHGFPGEDLQTTYETVAFLGRMKKYLHRVVLYRFVPLPGSPIFGNNGIYKRGWKDYTIYDNQNHWWGSEQDFHNVVTGYAQLQTVIKELFGKIN